MVTFVVVCSVFVAIRFESVSAARAPSFLSPFPHQQSPPARQQRIFSVNNGIFSWCIRYTKVPGLSCIHGRTRCYRWTLAKTLNRCNRFLVENASLCVYGCVTNDACDERWSPTKSIFLPRTNAETFPELFLAICSAATHVAVTAYSDEKGKNVMTIIRIWHFDKGEPTTVE